MREEIKRNEERGGKTVLVNDKIQNVIGLRGVVNPISKDLIWPLVQLLVQNASFKPHLLFAVMLL